MYISIVIATAITLSFGSCEASARGGSGGHDSNASSGVQPLHGPDLATIRLSIIPCTGRDQPTTPSVPPRPWCGIIGTSTGLGAAIRIMVTTAGPRAESP